MTTALKWLVPHGGRFKLNVHRFMLRKNLMYNPVIAYRHKITLFFTFSQYF